MSGFSPFIRQLAGLISNVNSSNVYVQVVLIFLAAIVSFIILMYIVLLLLCNQKTYDYSDKHVIVTGGSSGIGLELAYIYLKLGARVTIAARDENKLNAASQRLLSLLPQCKDKLFIISVDISTNEKIVKSKLKAALDNFGPCDVLVNNAGTSVAGAFEELKDNDFQNMLNVNFLGAVHVTRAVVDGMKKRGGGRIIFVSSQLGQLGLWGYTAYCASKWALRGFAEALQMEVRPYDIFVSVAYPPDTKTPGFNEENLSKPDLTKILLEGSGQLFAADHVARAIVDQSTRKTFNVTVGLDGWFLKCSQPGMSPVGNALDAVFSVLMPGLMRLVALFYLFHWDGVVADYHRKLGQGHQVHVPKNDNRTVINGSGSGASATASSTDIHPATGNSNCTRKSTRSARKTRKE